MYFCLDCPKVNSIADIDKLFQLANIFQCLGGGTIWNLTLWPGTAAMLGGIALARGL